MADRLAAIRDTRPHFAEGLIRFGQRVREILEFDNDLHFIVAVLGVIAPSHDACMGSAEWLSDGHLGP